MSNKIVSEAAHCFQKVLHKFKLTLQAKHCKTDGCEIQLNFSRLEYADIKFYQMLKGFELGIEIFHKFFLFLTYLIDFPFYFNNTNSTGVKIIKFYRRLILHARTSVVIMWLILN